MRRPAGNASAHGLQKAARQPQLPLFQSRRQQEATAGMVTATELREGGLSAAGAPAGPAGGADFATAVASVPITHQHGVESLRGLDKRLPNPGGPRRQAAHAVGQPWLRWTA